MKKKLTKTGARVGKSDWYEKRPIPHPAAQAAESDLVKLTREHDELQRKLKENCERVTAIHQESHRLWEESQRQERQTSEQVGAIERESRLLRAQLDNVDELISKQVKRPSLLR